MHYLIVSFTHKNTDITMREKLSFSNETKMRELQTRIGQFEYINESIVLSTCNRVEIIASVKDCKNAEKTIFSELSHASGLDRVLLESRADVYEDNGAIHHLFFVASSLDSLVIGETQIVGQLKDSCKFSNEESFCSIKLNRAMDNAFRCAAQVRASTSISKNPVSVSSVAVSKAKDILGSLDGEIAVLVGAGEMSALAGKHLISNGAKVIIVNRSIEKAQELSDELGKSASIESYSNLKKILNKHKLLFSATGAPHSVITADMVEDREFERYWFDIAVPRDIEDSCSGVEIYAVDDLEEIVSKNLSLREEQAKVAYSIVSRSTMDFFKWLQTLSIDPLIKTLRDQAKECSIKEVKRAIKKGYIPSEYEKSLEKILHSAFNAFLHSPTKKLKDISENPEADRLVQSMQEIFNIEEDSTKQLNMYKCEFHTSIEKNGENNEI